MELERDRTGSGYSEITLNSTITAEEKGGIKSAAGLRDSFFGLRPKRRLRINEMPQLTWLAVAAEAGNKIFRKSWGRQVHGHQ